MLLEAKGTAEINGQPPEAQGEAGPEPLTASEGTSPAADPGI